MPKKKPAAKPATKKAATKKVAAKPKVVKKPAVVVKPKVKVKAAKVATPKKKTALKQPAKKIAVKKPLKPVAKKVAKKASRKIVKPAAQKTSKIVKKPVTKAVVKKKGVTAKPLVKKSGVVASKGAPAVIKPVAAAKKLKKAKAPRHRTTIFTKKKDVPKRKPRKPSGLKLYAKALRQALAAKKPAGPPLVTILRPHYGEDGRVSKDAERLLGVSRKVH
jgi:hypothetical protein